MATTKAKQKTHGLFWQLLANLPEVMQAPVDERKEVMELVKQSWVWDASGQKTESLGELWKKYPAQYSKMIEELKEKTGEQKKRHTRLSAEDEEADKWRKRVIAVISKWLDLRNAKFESQFHRMEYIKATACTAASCDDFNKITVGRLTDIYNEWLRKNTTIANGGGGVNDFSISPN